MSNAHISSHKRFSQCNVCAYKDTHPIESPCDNCKRRTNPLKPIGKIYINNILYVLADKGGDAK